MALNNTVILSIPTGTLSVGAKKVLHGDSWMALAAHDYFEQFGGQAGAVRRLMPSSAVRGFSSRGMNTKTRKVVAYAIDDVEALERWWNLAN